MIELVETRKTQTISTTQKLRVLQLIGNLEIGGAQEVVRTLSEYLTENGCEVVVCSFRDGPIRQEIERAGIPVIILPGRKHSILEFPGYIKDMRRIRQSLKDIIQEYQIDVIQTHLLRSLDFLTLSLREKSGKPAVFWTVHNYQFDLRLDQLPRFRFLLGPKRLAHRIFYREGSRWADGFIAVSDEVETSILENIRPPKEKVTAISNGVDVRRYDRQVDKAQMRRDLGLPGDAVVIAVVGTLKEQKGHRYLLEALPEVIRQYPEVHALIIGGGSLQADLEQRTQKTRIDSHVHFLGNRGDVPDLLAGSDLFVLPSLWEGLPMALIEAMAAGLPIVATAVSGTNEVMENGETGLVVPPGDSQALCEAVLSLLSNSEKAADMGSAARERVITQYSAEKQALKHLELFSSTHRNSFRND